MPPDIFVKGSLSGIIGTVLMAIPNLILWKSGVIEYTYFQVAASALLPVSKSPSLIGLTTGLIADLVTGSILGLLLIVVFELTGYDIWWYKGAFFGAAVWLLAFGVALNLGVASINPSGEVIQITSFIEHLIFGISAAYFIVRWSSNKKSFRTR